MYHKAELYSRWIHSCNTRVYLMEHSVMHAWKNKYSQICLITISERKYLKVEFVISGRFFLAKGMRKYIKSEKPIELLLVIHWSLAGEVHSKQMSCSSGHPLVTCWGSPLKTNELLLWSSTGHLLGKSTQNKWVAPCHPLVICCQHR